MASQNYLIHQAKYLKARALVRGFKQANVKRLLQDPNIVGVAFGRRTAHGQVTDDPAMVVYVMHKGPARFVPPSRLLPRKIYIGGDCVEVDVVETGPIYPQSFTARERPAPLGVSIAHPSVTAGTLGALVIDNTDGTNCILSNNHVMAAQNAATLGDPIVQPGPFDGGASPGDDIGSLKRFVMLNATGNVVDGAIAEIAGKLGVNVIDQVKDNIIPTANADHPAVGLLFAGGCNITILNPIRDVLSQLNISFPNGPGAVTGPDIGMNVEKVGRTTEYTTSTIKEIDATVTIGYDFGPATFDNQITTGWMCDGGDSGSVVYRGGDGGDIDNCGCGTSSAAEAVLQSNLGRERAMADEVRDKYLRHTKIGRWVMDVFFDNEEQLLERYRQTKIDEDDKEFARKMFGRYRELGERLFVERESATQTVTKQHVNDARAALARVQKYLTPTECDASHKLATIAEQRLTGKATRDVLAMLNDEKLLEQLKDVLSKVETLRLDDCGCGKSKRGS